MPQKVIDETGKKYGELTVIKRVYSKSKNAEWLCNCTCGKQVVIAGINLRRPAKSCGCKKIVGIKKAQTKHGYSKRNNISSEYSIWATMKQRCTNRNSKDYPNYGGRGIKVCSRWEKFENFIADMGERPNPELTLERINNNRGYTPTNCRWATQSDQALNRRRRN